VKGVPAGSATIIVAEGNFHGRTTTIVGFSDDPGSRHGFGPFTPGFRPVPFGDAAAMAAAIDASTAAVLIEPIQGEAGVVVPPDGYLAQVRELCTRRRVLLVVDEVQSGLGRTGTTFACEHEKVQPDAYLLGKALGGGIVPLSAVVARREVLEVFGPGDHGSTFGGNPLACAIGLEVLSLLRSGWYQARSRRLGAVLADRLAGLPAGRVKAVRARGLWAGVDVTGRSGRSVCEGLAQRGVLAKETHGSTLRIAPPLVISEDDLCWGLDQLAAELAA
jgi:ornithine--oxo-acid transaminase